MKLPDVIYADAYWCHRLYAFKMRARKKGDLYVVTMNEYGSKKIRAVARHRLGVVEETKKDVWQFKENVSCTKQEVYLMTKPVASTPGGCVAELLFKLIPTETDFELKVHSLIFDEETVSIAGK